MPLASIALLAIALGAAFLTFRSPNEIGAMLAGGSALVCLIGSVVIAPPLLQIILLVTAVVVEQWMRSQQRMFYRRFIRRPSGSRL